MQVELGRDESREKLAERCIYRIEWIQREEWSPEIHVVNKKEKGKGGAGVVGSL